jgi:hypothetical protein
MILPDIRQLNPNYFTDYQSVAFFASHRKAEIDSEKLEDFKQKWISGTATLTDWIKIGPIDVDGIVRSANLEEAQMQKIKERQKELYNQWQVMYLDQHYLYTFKKVYNTTPAFAPKYAEIQLQLIELLLQGNDITKNAHEPRMLRHEQNVDYPGLYKLYTNGAVNPFDIYSPSKDVWLHQLLTYKEFLEEFIKDPVIEETKVEYDPDDFSLAALYPNTIAMLSKLTVEYSFTDRHFKEETYRTYEIRKVNGHYSESSYRSALKKSYKEEYKAMLHKLRAVDKSEWEDYFEALVGELHELRQEILTTEEYKQEEGEYTEERIYTYNRVKQMAFLGKADTFLAFDQSESSTYRYLVKIAAPFADVVSETISALIGKLEDTGNYLDLLDFAMEVAAENSSPAISFDYKQKTTQYENITDFYNALKDARLIESTTTLAAFRTAFTGRRVNRKIGWTGTVGQLQYIIKQLHNVKGKVEPLGKRLWETACHCFERPGGVQFEAGQLRQAKAPAITTELDRILNNL